MKLAIAAAALCLTSAAGAEAAVVVLDFEGVGNGARVNSFYDGGSDSQGHRGTDYGVRFTSDSLGVVDSDAGGGGNFANEPSPNTILFFLTGDAATLNYSTGFDTGFSFFYTAAFTPGVVSVFDGLNGRGNVLATINLAVNSQNCTGDPNGQYCEFTPIGVTFDGVARSVDFGGTANMIGFDNITFGSAAPGGAPSVPEPASWTMMIAGFGAAGVALRRRTRRLVPLCA